MPRYSNAYDRVVSINRLDVAHRKGWKPSDDPGVPTGFYLSEEVVELKDALVVYSEAEANLPEYMDCDEVRKYSASYADVKQELGDVYGCLLQICYKLGINFQELDDEAVRKMYLRFPKLALAEQIAPDHHI